MRAVSVDPERLARFERDAQVLASLSHPRIHQQAIAGSEECRSDCLSHLAWRPQTYDATVTSLARSDGTMLARASRRG